METLNTPDRPQFVIRLTRDGDANQKVAIGYAIVEQTMLVAEDGSGGAADPVMLDEMRRLFEQRADQTLAALPLPGGAGDRPPLELASFAGASVDAGASVEA